MLHNHSFGCHHSFSHCSTCDVVYCSKCNKEWKFNFGSITYTYPTITPYIITSGGTLVGGNNTIHTHS